MKSIKNANDPVAASVRRTGDGLNSVNAYKDCITDRNIDIRVKSHLSPKSIAFERKTRSHKTFDAGVNISYSKDAGVNFTVLVYYGL